MKIHYSVIIVLIIALYTRTIIAFSIFFGCIILHELGHLFFIKLFKQKAGKLNITIFGGQLECYIGNISNIKILLINLGGIMMNLFIIYFARFFSGYYYQVVLNYNYLLIIFNLLPIYPLDGYRIIEILLIRLPINLGFAIITIISLTMVVVLVIYGLSINSLGIIIIALFLLARNIQRIRGRDQIIIRRFIKQYTKA